MDLETQSIGSSELLDDIIEELLDGNISKIWDEEQSNEPKYGKQYIISLQATDRGNYSKLIAFAEK